VFLQAKEQSYPGLKGTTTYPFVPKSSKRLAPGDFWAIPLRDGRFACGRVVELLPQGMPGARVALLGGLLDWQGSSEPTGESIAGGSFLAQGIMHIRSITTTGGSISGHRDFSLDSLGSWTFICGNKIQRGFRFVRPWCLDDNKHFTSLSWWSYDLIQIKANQYFVDYVANAGKPPWWLPPEPQR
jgi:hypothetical protein